MSKVHANLIKVNLKAGNKELAVKTALLASIDSGNVDTLEDGTKLYNVYLDNAYALVANGVTRKEWAGYLSSLTNKGFYKPQYDQAFGYVVQGVEQE